MMNIQPDYSSITHKCTLASACIYKHIDKHVSNCFCLHVLKRTSLCPHLLFVLSCKYANGGGHYTHTQIYTRAHTLIDPEASSTAFQWGYDHPARMIKLVRHQCSLRHINVWLWMCVYVFFQCSLKPETDSSRGENKGGPVPGRNLWHHSSSPSWAEA